MKSSPQMVLPTNPSPALRFAADEFSRLFSLVTGKTPILTDNPDPNRDLVIFGQNAVNEVAAEMYLSQRVDFRLRYGTDDYELRSVADGERQILFICGGRDRAVIYACYRFFEKYAGCRYFWDGERVPQNEVLSIDNVDLFESPRFELRGIRYFAHRSLHRFQAEHWGIEDWKEEIHWLLKKRLNLFMLRIGMDDLFQKAFPDIVDYPAADEIFPEAGADHDDRTLFWSLQYRGELRKQILRYAADLDLLHPEDCGTMTHWYSRTPKQYLETVKPALLSQSTEIYNEATGLVWDIRQEKYLQDYFKLTDAHVTHYGSGQMFHTIGLAERMYSADRAENLRLKQHVYHKIGRYIQEKYPNAPLLIASWDFFYTYKPEEVAAVVGKLNPAQAIVFDYTSDSATESNFTNWDVVGKFPWVFGLFIGLQANNELRGDYKLIEERLTVAKDDPYCKGMILWPEMSHSDIFTLTYFTDNAWSPLTRSLPDFLRDFCTDRYAENAEEMRVIWTEFLPILQMHTWSAVPGEKNETDAFFCPFTYNKFEAKALDSFDHRLKKASENRVAAVSILNKLAEVNFTNEMIRRDAYDLARTVIGRYLTAAFQLVQKRFAEQKAEEVLVLCEQILALLQQLEALLAGNEDYSLHVSLERLKSIAPVNPLFEQTLKNNASAPYCRSYIYENVRFLYIPETRLLFDWVVANLQGEADKTPYADKQTEVKNTFNSIPLADMQPKEGEYPDFAAVVKKAANLITEIEF